MSINLRKSRVKDTVAWIKYPELDGFEVKIKYLSKKDLLALGKRCTVKQMDVQNPGQTKEDIDQDQYRKLVAKEVLLDWKGLTIAGAKVLISLGEDFDDAEEVEATEDNKKLLLEESINFDSWFQNVMSSLTHFRAKKTEEELDNLN